MSIRHQAPAASPCLPTGAARGAQRGVKALGGQPRVVQREQPLAALRAAGAVLGLPDLPAGTVPDWLAAAVAASASGWFISHWSARSASSTWVIGTVPYSSAMPVCSACGHSCRAASHIRPRSSGEVDDPS